MTDNAAYYERRIVVSMSSTKKRRSFLASDRARSLRIPILGNVTN